MSKTADEIVVGANGSVYLAPVGTTEPADISASWPAGWTDLGFTSEDGVTINDSKEITDIPVWQLFYAARKIVTAKDLQISFALRQFNGVNVEFAFGGGLVSVDGTGKYRYTPPAPEDIDERALGIEWLDGDKTYRWIIPRGLIVDDVETNIVRTAAADLPITFGIIGEADVDPWVLLTDDPSFADIVGS